MIDKRTRSQRLADAVTRFSGSWTFITWFVVITVMWIFANMWGTAHWDPYPFLFLNWILTVVSTFQNPLIMLSQNRQNENDMLQTEEILSRLKDLQKQLNQLETRMVK